MSYRFGPGLILCSLLALAFVACGGDDDSPSEADQPTATDNATPAPTVPGSGGWFDHGDVNRDVGYTGPLLTQEQIAQAQEIAEADPIMADLATRTAYYVQTVGPWVSSDVLIGVFAVVELDSPQTIEADWPRYSESQGARTVHFTANDLTVLSLSIDLERNVVGEIQVVSSESISGYPQ